MSAPALSTGHPLEVSVVAGGEATGGAYALLEVRAAAGTVLPPHVALRHDDLLVVLAGELEVETRTGISVLAAGEHVSLARRLPRRLCARTDVHVLVLTLPAGLEALADLPSLPSLDGDDLAALLAAAGISLLPRAWRPT
jgi:quercetin dioxygenase-like cupin family protein